MYVQILSKLPVLFAEIRPPKPKKSYQIVHVFGSAFGFGAYMYVKALIGFKPFYFSFRFQCICEIALNQMCCWSLRGGSFEYHNIGFVLK